MHTATLRESGYDGSALRIDTETGAVVGTWMPIPGEADPRLDYQLPAELCRCCGRVLLRSGSKFSIWFCDECKGRVRALNFAIGRCVIPLGRHTFCNGIGTKPVGLWHHADVERFVTDCRGIWESMTVLQRWAELAVHHNCVVLGLNAHPSALFSDYLEAVKKGGVPKGDAFSQLLDWWAT